MAFRVRPVEGLCPACPLKAGSAGRPTLQAGVQMFYQSAKSAKPGCRQEIFNYLATPRPQEEMQKPVAAPPRCPKLPLLPMTRTSRTEGGALASRSPRRYRLELGPDRGRYRDRQGYA